MQVEEGDLRAVLSPAGFVWELTVPRNPDGTNPPADPCLATPVTPNTFPM